MLLSLRSKQLNNKMKTAIKYQQSKKDTDRWLEGQERKVAQLPPVSGNVATLQTQVDQVKVSIIEVVPTWGIGL